ncbi:alpha/beta hydrolase [Knoellia koreensis]|uniref:Alpha/beta fold hydrolase n=1 Tax=Knoellia koreensis TaxID=2730921 RepID=A0A849HI16_9MICO|nr:alpha/beta hydrolase [Knoellia sp. DB2414S]NNM47068.1 alpha/beta fold hydrolase [Knoellia sp. DB2414S]
MRKSWAVVAGAVALAVGLSGCSVLEGDPNKAPEPSITIKRTPPPGSEALAKFYSQELSWKGCGVGQCADLTVPLDYSKPDGETVKISVLRMRATRPNEREGSIVVNPGGPGGSGVDYARAADFIVGKPVRQRFDIVGFDPRGVGRSDPVDCLSDAGMDEFLGSEQTPDDAAEAQGFLAEGKKLGDGCVQLSGDLAANISTIDAAKDMDILRSALGDAKLNYLGKSYGTYLGAIYADLFPKLVGRFVLDGVLPPDTTPEENALGQAEGFERATRAWAADCVDGGNCPLGNSVDAVMAGMRQMFKDLDAKPVPVSGDARVKELTEAWASTGVAQAMYDQGQWSTLTDAIAKVKQGDGTDLMGLADAYASRDPDGKYTSNLLEAFFAISCLDNPDSPDASTYEERAKAFAQKAPTWGAFMAWGGAVCAQWPVKSDVKPHKVSAPGSGPIVVIGTTRDPATPYENSVRLADQLSNGRLISFDGDGHTAYGRSNSCVDNAVNDYYTEGKAPPKKLDC